MSQDLLDFARLVRAMREEQVFNPSYRLSRHDGKCLRKQLEARVDDLLSKIVNLGLAPLPCETRVK